jgi:endonuclease-8
MSRRAVLHQHPRMPEGPTILILQHQAQDFVGKTILRVRGTTMLDKNRLLDRRIVAVRSWGKHFLIDLGDFAVRVHLLMFGTCRINSREETAPRLGLSFENGEELNFYTCSVKYIEGPLELVYDWSADVLADAWDPSAARKKLRVMDKPVCDALLDQTVFSGVGNIIKNEVLFRTRIHPLSIASALPYVKGRELVRQARQYSFDFLAWKRAGVLKKHWLVHTKSICPRCQVPLLKAYLGATNRRSFFCEHCQKQYGELAAAGLAFETEAESQ